MNGGLIRQTASMLQQVRQLLMQLGDEEYTYPVTLMSGASIGQHVRHVIEFFQELDRGYYNGRVNYDSRKRDLSIETLRYKSIAAIEEIITTIAKADRDLVMDSSGTEGLITVKSNYTRELIYNLEHTVHHMALLRIAVQQLSAIALPENFGVAESTIKYRESCAQ